MTTSPFKYAVIVLNKGYPITGLVKIGVTTPLPIKLITTSAAYKSIRAPTAEQDIIAHSTIECIVTMTTMN